MRTCLRLAVLVVGLFACSDDGNTRAPDTALDGVPPALSNQKRAEISFHPLGNANSFFCTLDGGTPFQCLSPFVMELADGAHTFEVSAALNAKVDETPATHSWTIDTVAPTTTVLSGPPALDNSASPTLTFEGTDDRGAITFECSLDGAAFAACTSPATVPVADGAHEFRVRAKDDAGNADDSPAVHAWTVDTSAPETTISAGPGEGTTSGPAGSFELTSNDAAATFECSLDGAAFTPCTSPVPFTLTDGTHAFAARAVDAGGLRDPSPAMRGWIVDAVAPDVTIAQGPPNPSNDSTPSFAFASSDATATFQCRVDGGAFAPCTSPLDSTQLADGNHAFDVRASDPFGNTSAPATHAWTVDTVAPTVSITGAPPAATADATPTITFSTAGAPVSIECAVDAGSFAACTSPFTSAALADGAHQITVRATDAAGNTGSSMASFSVDTTPPMVTIMTGPGALTNDPTPTFTFAVSGAMTVDCRIDAGAFTTCASPFTTGALGEGSHTFTVRGTDGVGNQATASSTFTVDTVAPTVTFTAQPAALSNDTTPTAAFNTAGAPATIECAVDGGAFAACTSPFTSGALADGNHTIAVRVTDGAGNSSTATTNSFAIDTVAPTVTITSEPGALSNDPTPSVAFTTAGSPTSTQCQVDAGAFATCTSPFTSGALADGNHTITVRVTDGAGNSSQATSNTFAIDTVAPTVAITAEPASPSNDNTPTVAFTTAGSPATTRCRVDAGALASCTSPFTPAAAVADGTHTITIVVTDAAGNTGSATTAAFLVDTAPPTVTITSQPAALSSDSTPTVAFTTGGSPASTQCQLDAGAFATCTSPFTTSVTDGAHTITVRVTDAVGNSVQATTNSFTVDTAAPTVAITSEPAALSNDTTPTVAFTTSGSPTSTQCRVDSGTLANCTSPFTASTVADGAHTITIVVTDGAGNSSSATTNSFTVDTVAPTVSITGQPNALSNDTTPTVTFTTAGGPTSIQCQVDGGAFATCTSPFTTTVTDGAHTITVRVADGVGNNSSATTSSFTVDTTAPVVTINSEPAALSNDNTPTVAFTVTGGASTIRCRVDAGTLATCTSPFTSGALADGNHTITIVATDAVGNAGSATTGTFAIDTVAPTVTITTQPLSLSNDSTPTVAFSTAGSPTVTQCRVDAGAFASCSSPFTTTVGDGSHTITVRVQDGAGNASTATTASFTVDTTPPTVLFDDRPPSTWPVNYFDMQFHANESATFTCSLNGGTFASCSSGQTFTTTYNALSTFTVRATDAVGNVGQASTTWTSVDGLVLHYPFEQGRTNNTSLLAQNPVYTADGSTANLPSVGGWAGTALGSAIPSHTYKTRRPLLSSGQTGFYTASFWVRTVNDLSNGTLLSTIGSGATAGFRVRFSGIGMTVEVLDPATGQLANRTVTVGLDKWTHVALQATGPGKGLAIYLNGNFQTVVNPPVGTGFDTGQTDLQIGNINGIDLDDLRFFNEAVNTTEICTTLARGFLNGQAVCVPLSPGFELDFENNRFVDTGLWDLPLIIPQSISFTGTRLGSGLHMLENASWGYTFGATGFRSFANSVPNSVGRSFSLWFDATQPVFGNLIQFTQSCPQGGTCGMSLAYTSTTNLTLFTGTGLGHQKLTDIPFTIQGQLTSVLVTEQRNAAGGTTSVTVFVNGQQAAVIPTDGVNIYASVSDSVLLAERGGMIVDEYEFWTADLAKDPEALCENGLDGELDHLTGSCALTSL